MTTMTIMTKMTGRPPIVAELMRTTMTVIAIFLITIMMTTIIMGTVKAEQLSSLDQS